MVAPGSRRRRRHTVYDSQIDPLGLVAPKLILQTHLRIARVAKTTRPDVSRSMRWTTKGRPPPFGAQVIGERVLDRRRLVAARQRHRQQPGRLVDDDQRFVLVDDGQLAAVAAAAADACANCPADPSRRRTRIARFEPPGRIGGAGFLVVEEHLPAIERFGRATARAEPSFGGEELVEARAASAATTHCRPPFDGS